MTMHNPPQPGAFIQEIYLSPNGISSRELAQKLGVAASTLNCVLNEASAISPEIALRLSKALGRTHESWLTMQQNFDLWQVKKTVNLREVTKVKFSFA